MGIKSYSTAVVPNSEYRYIPEDMSEYQGVSFRFTFRVLITMLSKTNKGMRTLEKSMTNLTSLTKEAGKDNI